MREVNITGNLIGAKSQLSDYCCCVKKGVLISFLASNMSICLYKSDFDAARDRLAAWWKGGDIGRPAMLIEVPRERPAEDVPVLPAPAGWQTDYSTTDFAYRVNLAQRACVSTHYLAEAMPDVSPDLAPNCLALYLGCKGIESPGTVWCEPVIADPGHARFQLDPENFYWQFTLRLVREQLRLGQGRFLTAFPDLIEGLDTLAAMRDSQTLLIDLIERPDWVRQSLRQITARYFEVYDPLYDMIKDDRGGSHFWAWAPGRVSKLQCDFSAMISPAMFGEFMAPVLKQMTERLDYSLYHWDGPGALVHHDHLLALPRLNMIQWTPGSGSEDVTDRRWWPYYHKTLEAGKSVMISFSDPGHLQVFKREFGAQLKRFMFSMRLKSLAEADECLRTVEG